MNGDARLALAGEMTIYRAAELKPVLLAALRDNPAGLEIDLSAVTDFDSAGVQLLLAARRTAKAAGGLVVLGALSEPVREVLDLLDLQDCFEPSAPLSTRGFP